MDYPLWIQQNLYFIFLGLFLMWMFRIPVMAKIYKLKFIDAHEAARIYNDKKEKSLFLDIRTKGETAQEPVIKNAHLLPMDELQDRMEELAPYKQGHKVVVVCRSGNRAKGVGLRLKKAGFFDVSVMRGGMIMWQRGNYAVSRSKQRKKGKKNRAA